MWFRTFGTLPVELVQEVSDWLSFADILRLEMGNRQLKHMVADSLLHHHFAQRLLKKIMETPAEQSLEIMEKETQLPVYRKLNQLFDSRWKAGIGEVMMCSQLHVMAYNIFSVHLPMSFCPLPWPKFEFHQWFLSRICDKAYHHHLLYNIYNKLPFNSELQSQATEHYSQVREFYKTMPSTILGRLSVAYLREESSFLNSHQVGSVHQKVKSNYVKCEMCSTQVPEMETAYESLCVFCSSNPLLHHRYLSKQQHKISRKRKTYASTLTNKIDSSVDMIVSDN